MQCEDSGVIYIFKSVTLKHLVSKGFQFPCPLHVLCQRLICRIPLDHQDHVGLMWLEASSTSVTLYLDVRRYVCQGDCYLRVETEPLAQDLFASCVLFTFPAWASHPHEGMQAWLVRLEPARKRDWRCRKPGRSAKWQPKNTCKLDKSNQINTIAKLTHWQFGSRNQCFQLRTPLMNWTLTCAFGPIHCRTPMRWRMLSIFLGSGKSRLSTTNSFGQKMRSSDKSGLPSYPACCKSFHCCWSIC